MRLAKIPSRSKPNYYLLITSDPELEPGGKGQAQDLIKHRLAARAWPIFQRTKQKNQISKEKKTN